MKAGVKATASFQFTPEMLLRGYWWYNARKIKILTLFVAVFTVFVLYTNRGEPDFGFVVGICAFAWFMLVLGSAGIPWIRFRGMAKEPNLAGQIDLEFDDNGVFANNGAVASHYTWDTITAWSESPRLIYLKFGKKQVIVVPKSGFAAGADLDRARELLRRHVR